MDNSDSIFHREPQPFYKLSHKAWYLQLGNTQHRLCKGDTPQKIPREGQKKWHRLMARLDSEAVEGASDQGPTVVGLVAAFLASVKLQVSHKKLAKRTLEWYEEHLDRFVEFINDELSVNEFKKPHVKKWLGQDYALAGDNYRNGAVRAISRVFNWAIEEELIAKNPIAGYKRDSYLPRECELTDEQWSLVRSVLKGDDPFTEIVWFLYLTGCRPNEATTATHFHFDRQARALIFERVNSKGKKNRRAVVLDEKSLAIVERCMIKVEQRLLTWESEKEPIRNLFTNCKGHAWTSYSLNCRFARVRKALAEKGHAFPVFPYIFRHTFATRKLKEGLTSSNVAALLGHKGTAMVDQVYGHLNNLNHLHNELRRTSA